MPVRPTHSTQPNHLPPLRDPTAKWSTRSVQAAHRHVDETANGLQGQE